MAFTMLHEMYGGRTVGGSAAQEAALFAHMALERAVYTSQGKTLARVRKCDRRAACLASCPPPSPRPRARTQMRCFKAVRRGRGRARARL